MTEERDGWRRKGPMRSARSAVWLGWEEGHCYDGWEEPGVMASLEEKAVRVISA